MSRLDNLWNRATTWVRYAAEHIYTGTNLLPQRINSALDAWVARDGVTKKEKALRGAVVPGAIAVILLASLRPSSGMTWVVTGALAGIILFALAVAPVAAILLLVAIGAHAAPLVMAPAVALWCWRAYRASEDEELPELLDQALGDTLTIRLSAAADIINGLAGRPAWTARKVENSLDRMGCPIHSMPGKDEQGKKTTVPGLTRVDLDQLLPDPDDEAADDADSAPAEEATEQAPIDPLLALCATLTGDASGVHVNALVGRLNKPGGTPSFTTDTVRSALADLGVPIRPSVRGYKGGVLGGEIGVARGVHREDLEAVIGPLSSIATTYPSPGVATDVAAPVTCDVVPPATAVAGDVATPTTPQKGHFDTGMIITK